MMCRQLRLSNGDKKRTFIDAVADFTIRISENRFPGAPQSLLARWKARPLRVDHAGGLLPLPNGEMPLPEVGQSAPPHARTNQ